MTCLTKTTFTEAEKKASRLAWLADVHNPNPILLEPKPDVPDLMAYLVPEQMKIDK